MSRIKILSVIAFTFLTSIVSAEPDVNDSALTWFMWNASLIVTSLTTMFTSVMGVFMEPPLVIFVAMGIFAVIIGIVAKYMSGKRR